MKELFLVLPEVELGRCAQPLQAMLSEGCSAFDC